MAFLQAIVLGIVQGLTEFLPVSSSAHLIIVPWLFRWNDGLLKSLTFDVALHMGTLVALIWFFAADWSRLIRAGVASVVERRIGAEHERRMAWLLLIGSIPAALAGVLAEREIEGLFYNPGSDNRTGVFVVMAVIIALGGLALWAADYFGRRRRKMEQLTVGDAIVIGVAQALAIVPGVSRSGSTIMAGLAMRLERTAAARFSFLLASPIIFAAGLKKTVDLGRQIHAGTLTPGDMTLVAVGFLTAALSGYYSIKYLLRFFETNSTAVFAAYRCVLAGLVVVVAIARS